MVTNSAGEDKRDFRVTIQGRFAEFFFSKEIIPDSNIQYRRLYRFEDLTSTWSFLTVPPVFHRVANREAAWGLGHEGDDKDDTVERLDVVLGHPVSLSCESNAIPPPQLSWHKDGQKLEFTDGVLLLPGRMTLCLICGRASCALLIKGGLPFQEDRCYKLLERRKKMLEGTRVRLLMKRERTTCTLNCAS